MGKGEGGGVPARELTDEERAQVEALAAYLNQEQIGDYLGISRSTFQRILVRDEDVAIRYRRGAAKAVGRVAQSLIKKADAGSSSDIQFFLRTQGGWNETVINEHFSPDGSMSPKDAGPVAFYELPDNGRDKPAPETKPNPKRKPRTKKPKTKKDK